MRFHLLEIVHSVISYLDGVAGTEKRKICLDVKTREANIKKIFNFLDSGILSDLGERFPATLGNAAGMQSWVIHILGWTPKTKIKLNVYHLTWPVPA